MWNQIISLKGQGTPRGLMTTQGQGASQGRGTSEIFRTKGGDMSYTKRCIRNKNFYSGKHSY